MTKAENSSALSTDPQDRELLRVLCVVGSAPQLNELLDAVEALKQVRTVLCRIEFDGFQPSRDMQDMLAHKGYEFPVPAPPTHRSTPVPPGQWRLALRRALRALPTPLLDLGINAFRLLAYAQVAATPFWLRRYKRHFQQCRRMLEDWNPSVVLLAVDAATYQSGSWIRAAREAGMPAALIPFAMADHHTLASERLPIPAYRVIGPASRYVAARYPQWATTFERRNLLLLPAAQALAKQLAGTVEAQPWTYNDSRADLTLLESEHARQQLLADGAVSSKFVVTGRIAHDRLARARNSRDEVLAAVQQEHGLNPDLPLVVASVTPDKFDVYGAATEFSSYQEMLEFWAATLANPAACNVLASVHPSQPVETVRFIERPGLVISRRPLAEILPLAELFVVDCSATSRLAAASGVPVLDYDLYGFDLKFNQVGKGLVHVKTRTEFQAKWRDLWHTPDYLPALQAAQAANAEEFGVLDGRAGRRIAEAITELCSTYEVDQKR